MTPRCPERLAVGSRYGRCHRRPGHKPPCHTTGFTWLTTGEQGQQIRERAECFPDCLPVPSAPQGRARGTTVTGNGSTVR